MMWYWGSGVHWWGWLLGILGMVVFWGVVVALIWYAVTALGRRPGAGPERTGGDPKRILDERLARGEIDAEEYRHLRDLMGARTGRPADGKEAVGAREER